MLNIARMGPGSENYYLDQVARGINDYYLGHGEAPGRWLGLGIDELGLAGEVAVPRWLAPVGLLEHAVPERLGEVAKRFAGAQRRMTSPQQAARRYQERISRS